MREMLSLIEVQENRTIHQRKPAEVRLINAEKAGLLMPDPDGKPGRLILNDGTHN